MTPQEIFDKAALGVLKQGRRSTNGNIGGNERCMYRGEGGLKCAVGHLIDDDDLAREMDAFGAIAVVLSDAELRAKMPEWFVREQSLLGSLQDVHDRNMSYGFQEAIHGFRRVAKQRRLSSVVVDQWEADQIANA